MDSQPPHTNTHWGNAELWRALNTRLRAGLRWRSTRDTQATYASCTISHRRTYVDTLRRLYSAVSMGDTLLLTLPSAFCGGGLILSTRVRSPIDWTGLHRPIRSMSLHRCLPSWQCRHTLSAAAGYDSTLRIGHSFKKPIINLIDTSPSQSRLKCRDLHKQTLKTKVLSVCHTFLFHFCRTYHHLLSFLSSLFYFLTLLFFSFLFSQFLPSPGPIFLFLLYPDNCKIIYR